MRLLWAAVLATAATILPAKASGDEQVRPRFADTDVRSAFHIAKSENRNQVHYAVRANARCAPRGDAPVVPYWQVRERGGELLTLKDVERRVYGIESQRIVEGGPGGAVALQLRALPERPIVVRLERGPDGCHARAVTRIEGREAVIGQIYADLALIGVDYVDLIGRTVDGSGAVRERLDR